MPPALIAGGIAAVGAIGGALIGSSAQKKAASQANASQQQSMAGQLALGRESLALQDKLAQQSMGIGRDVYNSNYDLLSPWVSRGNVAGNAYNALLGLPAAPAMTSPMAGGGFSGQPAGVAPPAPQSAPIGGGTMPGASAGASGSTGRLPGRPYGATHPDANMISTLHQQAGEMSTRAGRMGDEPMSMFGTYGPGSINAVNSGTRAQGGSPLQALGGAHVQGSITGQVPTSTNAPPTASPAAPPAATPSAPAPSPQDAFKNFADSAGMKFQLEQGSNAINHLYAGRGALQSGAAMKAISDYGQNTALNNYFMPYMNMLGGVSSTGAQAGSAVAGVGSTFSNNAANINSNLANGSTAINGQMGNALQGGANSASAAAVARGNATGQMWQGIGGALGGFASSFNRPSGTNFGSLYNQANQGNWAVNI